MNLKDQFNFAGIRILEVCPNCGHNITVMPSIRIDEPDLGGVYMVARCLNCGGFRNPDGSVVEIAKIL